jgi:hypothetical protein
VSEISPLPANNNKKDVAQAQNFSQMFYTPYSILLTAAAMSVEV